MDLKETKGNNRHPWEIARADFIQALIKKYLPADQLSILDVGAGDLYSLKKIMAYFHCSNAAAIDSGFPTSPSEEQGIVKYNSIEHLPENSSFNLVLFMDILEHVKNDCEFFENITKQKNILPGTLMIITVPAFNSLFSSHDRFLSHHRRYNRSDLKQLVANTGIEILDSGYFFLSLLLFRLFTCFFESFAPTKEKTNTAVGNWQGGKILTLLLVGFLKFDLLISKFFKLFGITLPGLSAYIIAKNRIIN